MTSTGKAAGEIQIQIHERSLKYIPMACRLNGFPPRCSFILRRVGQVSSFSGDGVGSQKKKLKKVIFGIALIENDASIVENAGEEQHEAPECVPSGESSISRSLRHR